MEVSEIIARICQDVFTHPGPEAVINRLQNPGRGRLLYLVLGARCEDKLGLDARETQSVGGYVPGLQLVHSRLSGVAERI